MTHKVRGITKFLAIGLSLLAMCVALGISADLSQKKPGYYGGDGSSEKQAIIAIGIENSPAAWIAKKFPGSTIKEQSLVVPPKEAKAFDVYRVEKSDGTMTDVWFSASGGIDDLISNLASREHPVIELSDTATDAGDGFRIKVDAITPSKTTQTGHDYVLAIFDVDIPQRVGKSQLDQAAIEVLGNDGRTLVYAPLQSHKKNKQTFTVHVCVDQEFAAQSKLRCTYYSPSSEEIVKEYLIQLKDRLPSSLDPPK
jgi:hypothetical protein